jgi:hypothetical protein
MDDSSSVVARLLGVWDLRGLAGLALGFGFALEGLGLLSSSSSDEGAGEAEADDTSSSSSELSPAKLSSSSSDLAARFGFGLRDVDEVFLAVFFGAGSSSEELSSMITLPVERRRLAGRSDESAASSPVSSASEDI